MRKLAKWRIRSIILIALLLKLLLMRLSTNLLMYRRPILTGNSTFPPKDGTPHAKLRTR